jgi:hypothetical protein
MVGLPAQVFAHGPRRVQYELVIREQSCAGGHRHGIPTEEGASLGALL